ncbi:chromatin remodelling complex Rsc7/Swp82 subunit-domain-containing protein [Powellomyces hirtus]|nr:chromatin remodelling complex Rsc7/Swp82 subunit-domain-containing protein [Powellomyces hirtus]
MENPSTAPVTSVATHLPPSHNGTATSVSLPETTGVTNGIDTNQQSGSAPSTPSTRGRKRKTHTLTNGDDQSAPGSDTESIGTPTKRGRRKLTATAKENGRNLDDAANADDDSMLDVGDELDDDNDNDSTIDETKENQMIDVRPSDKKSQIEHKRVSALSQPVSTPAPRGRGRPPASAKPEPKDVYGVKNVNDEDFETEWDEKGELKISKDGDLLGGREYKMKTFTLPRHPTRRYMLTVDIAKTLAYRDTYIFFLKNPHITRVQGDEADKEYLVETGLLPGQLRRRPVSVATARSIFRSFGHKVVKRGKLVRDDYWVGDQEEPPEEPDRDLDFEDDMLNTGRNKGDSKLSQLSTRESALKRNIRGMTQEEREIHFPFTTGPRVPITASLTGDDVLYKRAASAADFNRRLMMNRPRTFLDGHTNIEQIPSLTQPQSIAIQLKKGTWQSPVAVENSVISSPTSNGDAPDFPADPNDVWIHIPTLSVEELYPVAIMPGQYQGMYPIYRSRFSVSENTENPVISAADQSREEQPTFVPPPKPLPAVAAVDYTPAPARAQPVNGTLDSTGTIVMSSRIKHMEHACGEITRSGLGCKRPVYNAGEKCLYHVKPVGPPAINPAACIHCHSITPPGSTTKSAPGAATLLTCAGCKTNHHPQCIDFDDAVLICKAQTYPWHCSECKTCVKCERAGDDSRLLFCDTCDRGYHTFCLDPPLDDAPEGTWLCPLCANCTSCQTMTAASWSHAVIPPNKGQTGVTSAFGTYLCTYCPSCYKHYQNKSFCPVCMCVYREDEDSAMVCCDACDRWIHVDCDPDLTHAQYEKLVEEPDSKYTCLLCSSDKLDRVLGHLNTGVPVKQKRRIVAFEGKKLVAPPIGRGLGVALEDHKDSRANSPT